MNLRATLFGTAGVSLLMLSGVLLVEHIEILRSVRDTSLPLAATLTNLEERAQVLSRQKELADAELDLRGSAPEEKMKAYVLPESQDTARILSFLEHVRDALLQQKMLSSMSAITLSTQSHTENGAKNQTLSFDVTASLEGRSTLLRLLDLTGFVTVSDALSSEQLERLFTLAEAENYAGIADIEAFLRTDLLTYSREPKAFDDRLTASFPSERFLSDLHRLLESSSLQNAREILGGSLGEMLQREKLWPVPFLLLKKADVTHISTQEEQVHLEFTLPLRAPKGTPQS